MVLERFEAFAVDLYWASDWVLKKVSKIKRIHKNLLSDSKDGEDFGTAESVDHPNDDWDDLNDLLKNLACAWHMEKGSIRFWIF